MELSFDDLIPRLRMSDILQLVPEEIIYKRYCPEFPSSSMPSPYRRDKTPSFGFYVGRNGRWLWKDNGRGGKGDRGDVFDLVAAMEYTDIRGAIQHIAKTFKIDNYAIAGIQARDRETAAALQANRKPKERALIQAFHRAYQDSDINLWNSWCIHSPILIEYGIKVAHEVWMKKPEWPDKRLIWSYRQNNPIFYWVSPFSNHIKVYRPLEPDKRHKWLSNMDDLTDIQGYLQAHIKERRPRLLLVKSMKEVMFFRGFGYTAMAQNAEGYTINPDFIRHIKQHCPQILAIYDRDITGVMGMQRLRKEHKIHGLVIPNWGAKDPTDLWKLNYKRAYQLINIIDGYFEHIRQYPGVEEAPYGFHYT